MDTKEGFDEHRAWERTLAADRWSVVTWPEKYGGRGATGIEWLLFEEEYYAAKAPGRITQNGIFLLGPTLFAFGTEEQKERFLPRMADAAEVWAQAWSEPEAGSDLAALRSRGTRVAGGWLLSGQKAWSTRASFADWAFGLFRTDPASSRHEGLTYFVFPLSADGLVVSTTRRLDGAAVFADVFLDDVFVPDANVIGEVGGGWGVAMASTTSERGMTLRSPGRFLASANALAELARKVAGGSHALDADIVDCLVDAAAYRARGFGVATRVAAGAQVGAEASADKLFWSHLDLRIHRTALELLNLDSAPPENVGAEERERWLDGFLFALAGPIYAGTNEIQRNILAQRVLGMPRK